MIDGLDSLIYTVRLFPSVVDEKTEAVLNEATARGYGRMYSLTPVKTGALRASLFAKVVGRTKVEIGATALHGIFVEEGTRPHEIRPVRASVLRFEIGGKVIYTKRVMHPGTRAQPFVRPSAILIKELIPELMWREIRHYLKGRGWG